jgi:serine/threonine protein kinase
MKPDPGVTLTEDDPRLLRAAQEYLAALESGQRPERRAFLARFPEVASLLGPYLDTLDAVHAASPVMNNLSGGKRPAPGSEIPIEPLGDFRIVREIGRGGMGIVYEAVQLSLGRRVALKVLPFAAALDARQLQRFKNEAQAAAQLHHPNIVPVYYVGLERGIHFYAMQYIEGQTLAAVVEDLQRDFLPGVATEADRPRTGVVTKIQPAPRPVVRARGSAAERGSTTRIDKEVQAADTRPILGGQLSTQRSERPGDFYRAVAGLVAQAATALAHAHLVGIVHRDVKPANLLVDATGTLWITDFGLAQFHADAGLTQTGDLLGTLRYMSPEQAGGQRVLIDHRTDVYSLGATLYELLTLQPIFDGPDRQTLLRQILNEEPVAPRTIDHTIPAELETIFLKATAKAPAERYATAQDLADDLNRFLADMPIRARRPSLTDKVTRWARRHRGMVVSAVLALLVCVAGLSVSTVLAAWAYEREAKERAHAEDNAREADLQRRRAETNLKEAHEQRLQAVESLRQARRAVDLFTQISEEELAGNPAVEGLRKRLLDAALRYYQDFIDQGSDDPMLRAELEASRAKVETILRELTTFISARDYGILRQDSVQKELKITPSQRQVLDKIDERWKRSFDDFKRLGPEARDRRFLELARAQEEDVARSLDADQLRRFKQLAVQNLGLRAFSDADVVTALSLTPEQKRRVRELQEEAHAPLLLRHEPGRPDFEARRTREQQVRAKILDLLTPTQRQKWSELIGKPFQFDPPRPPPGPRP